MNGILGTIRADLKDRKHLELYLTLLVIIGVLIAILFADVFGVEIGAALVEIVLAALAVLIYGMLGEKRFEERVERRLASLEYEWGKVDRHYADIDKRLSQISQVTACLSRTESYASLLSKVRNAASSIDVVSYVCLEAADSKRLEYYTQLRGTIERKRIEHRRIVWNLDHLLWLERKLDEGWDELDGFAVKFYQVSLASESLTTFDLIDQTTIIFGQDWLVEGHLEIESPESGQYFRGYFASLWDRSEWIKRRGKPANREVLKKLVKELSSE